MEWISVRDRMPKPGEEVLVIDPSLKTPIVASWLKSGCWYSDYIFNAVLEGLDPTHWQPILEVPKLTVTQKAFNEAFANLLESASEDVTLHGWSGNAKNALGVEIEPWQVQMVINWAGSEIKGRDFSLSYHPDNMVKILALFISHWGDKS